MYYYVSVGSSLSRRLEDAAYEAPRLRALHIEFSASLPKDSVKKWAEMLKKWCDDPFNVCSPFAEVDEGTVSTSW